MKTWLRAIAMSLALLGTPALAQNGGATQDIQFSQTRTTTGTVIMTTNGQATVSLVATGTGSGMTFAGQGSNDGTNWTTLQGTVPSSGATATSFSANGTWLFSVAGFTTFRVNLTAISTGSETFALEASARGGGGGAGGGGGGGAVTIADGADVAQGATTDAACAGDNTSGCTVEQRLQRLAQNQTTQLAAINAAVPCLNATAATTNTYTTGQTNPLNCDLHGNLYATQSSQYPSGAVALTASATGTTGATTATLAGAVGKTTYICGYSIRANATAAATVTNTITGVITATLSSIMWVAPLASGIGVDEQIFSPCIPASATNTGIAIVSGAPGTGGTVSSKGWGYQL